MAILKARIKFVSVLVAIGAIFISRGGFAAPTTRPSSPETTDIFARSNLVAWCIVPYDGKQRTPVQRAEMLSRIGLRKFAYDWRGKHLPGFDTELDELDKRKIELTGVWFPDNLNKDARYILDCLAKHHVHTQLWVSSWANYGNDQETRVKSAAERMRTIAEEAGKIGCTVGLYNHGGWFGEPENEIAIIERLKSEGIKNVGIVYSLHHGYGDLDRFPELFGKMLPYLLDVNLNGTSKLPRGAGEPVVPVGQGALDVSLLKTIRDSGYSGPIGIINESNEDAELRLLDNIDGLNWLVPQLDGKPAGDRPQPRSWHMPK
jgi:sugar phosphate isomerase/epimerase